MSWTAKDLIKHLQDTYKPDEILWVPSIYDKSEISNLGDYEPTDDEWEQIVDDCGNDYVYENIWEDFTDAVKSNLSDHRCEECDEYSKDIKIIDGEKLCNGCIETATEEEQAEIKRQEQLKVSDDNIIY